MIDVLVVGLGPAGAMAAAVAARAGVSVVAIDRRRQAGVPVQCAEWVPSGLALEPCEVAAATVQPVRAMITQWSDRSRQRDTAYAGRMIDRAAFDARLVARAVEAGAICRFGEVWAPGRHPSAVIIGADGSRSVVGKAIGRSNRDLVSTRQATVRLRRAMEDVVIYRDLDLPGGYGWLIPRGEEAHVGVGVESAFRHRLKAALQRLLLCLGDEGVVERHVVRLTGGPLPAGGIVGPLGKLAGATVLLCGDAAGLANPVTGAGIAAAVQSGRLAGAAAAAIARGERDAGAGYAEEIRAMFGPSLTRALARRGEWVTNPAYWAA